MGQSTHDHSSELCRPRSEDGVSLRKIARRPHCGKGPLNGLANGRPSSTLDAMRASDQSQRPLAGYCCT